MSLFTHPGSILSDRRSWAIFLTCWLIYLFHIGPVPGVNENRYLDLTLSIVEDGTFTIDRFHYNTVDKSYRDGHYYAGAAPGPSLLGIPPYLALKALLTIRPLSLFGQYDVAGYIRREVGMKNAPDDFVTQYPFSDFILAHIVIASFVSSLFAAGVVVFLYQMLGWFPMSSSYRLLITGIYAFGTITFFYATRLYAHMPALFFCFGGFYLLWSIRDKHLSTHWAIPAGLMLGLSILMEYTTTPLVISTGLYGLFTLKGRAVGGYLVGGLIPGILLCFYHYLCFGSPFTTAYSFPMSPENPGPHVDLINVGIGGFGLPGITALWGLSFSAFRGIFVYTPALILAVYGLISQLKNRTSPYHLEWSIIAAGCVFQFLFNSAMLNFWSAGYVWGPRYLIPLLPFLMLALGTVAHRIPFWLLGITGSVSILINWTGTQYIVPQNAFGALPMFFLGGPSTQMYQFLQSYFTRYTRREIEILPLGGWIIIGAIIWSVRYFN